MRPICSYRTAAPDATEHRTPTRADRLRRRLLKRGVRALWAALALATATTTPLAAHDFWIEPTTFFPTVGAIVGVRARVGDGFLGDPVPRDSTLLDALVVETGSGRQPLVGRDGSDPAGMMRIASPGLHVVGYLGKPSRLELAADKFNAYLAQEGLDAVAATRARLNQTRQGARELFIRCAKTLVLSGGADTSQRDRTLGCDLELVAERNPYALESGQALPLTLSFQGRPVQGALVVAINRARPSEKVTARSDESGRVRLTLPMGGQWLIKSVHMVAAPAGTNADWASYWATLTFDLPQRATSAPGRS